MPADEEGRLEDIPRPLRPGRSPPGKERRPGRRCRADRVLQVTLYLFFEAQGEGSGEVLESLHRGEARSGPGGELSLLFLYLSPERSRKVQKAHLHLLPPPPLAPQRLLG